MMAFRSFWSCMGTPVQEYLQQDAQALIAKFMLILVLLRCCRPLFNPGTIIPRRTIQKTPYTDLGVDQTKAD
jgi:hypothetical protein